jgi:hypothetical protein
VFCHSANSVTDTFSQKLRPVTIRRLYQLSWKLANGLVADSMWRTEGLIWSPHQAFIYLLTNASDRSVQGLMRLSYLRTSLAPWKFRRHSISVPSLLRAHTWFVLRPSLLLSVSLSLLSAASNFQSKLLSLSPPLCSPDSGHCNKFCRIFSSSMRATMPNEL